MEEIMFDIAYLLMDGQNRPVKDRYDSTYFSVVGQVLNVNLGGVANPFTVVKDLSFVDCPNDPSYFKNLPYA
jgi:hypothetical protein